MSDLMQYPLAGILPAVEDRRDPGVLFGELRNLKHRRESIAADLTVQLQNCEELTASLSALDNVVPVIADAAEVNAQTTALRAEQNASRDTEDKLIAEISNINAQIATLNRTLNIKSEALTTARKYSESVAKKIYLAQDADISATQRLEQNGMKRKADKVRDELNFANKNKERLQRIIAAIDDQIETFNKARPSASAKSNSELIEIYEAK